MTKDELKIFMDKMLHRVGFNKDYYYQLYSEPHRHFHTIEHIECLLMKYFDSNVNLGDNLIYAIMFHDLVYNPKSTTNEEDSAGIFKAWTGDRMQYQEVYDAILSTKNHIPIEGNEISKVLIDLDMDSILGNFSKKDMFAEFMEGEPKVMKEYQFVDYKVYKEKRIEFLKSVNAPQHYIDFVENRKPNIAVYAGSFNPYHIGHHNVVQKAEKIFDKVIIARGVNPDKPEKESNFLNYPVALNYHQKEEYSTLLTDFIDSLGYDVTIIRGLRGATDLEYEKNQLYWLTEIKPDIKVINILCDNEFNNVSSSSIRAAGKFGVNVDRHINF
jgi:pantetheine-phosphate adenylyltransferase